MKVLQHTHSYLRRTNAGGTYEHTPDHKLNSPTVEFTCTERPIYGSSRVGLDVTQVVYTTATEALPEGEAVRLLGNKQYEVSNHLGNVLVVVSDVKIIVQDQGTITGYEAQIISATDYSPFGVVLEGRSWSAGSGYRYGFQAQEQDAELWEGAVNYKYRVEDPRLGRFFSVDPLYHKYPWNSTYAFSENIVVNAVELEGLECMYTSNYGVNPNRVRENLGDTNCDGIISQEEHDSAMLTLGSCAVVAGSVVAIYAVITYGIAAVGALVLEEAGEYAFEAITGIPVIVDPIDVCEQLIKKGAKKFATDVIVAGRQFGKDVPVVNIQYFAWNAKKYGENLANKLYDGIVKFGSRREVGNYANLGKLQKHLEQRNLQGYGFKDINQMQTYGKDFFKREGNEILEWTSPDGYIHRIDVAAQEYGVLTPNNEIMTVFKVTPGENSSFSNAQEYLEQQIKLYGKKD